MFLITYPPNTVEVVSPVWIVCVIVMCKSEPIDRDFNRAFKIRDI